MSGSSLRWRFLREEDGPEEAVAKTESAGFSSRSSAWLQVATLAACFCALVFVQVPAHAQPQEKRAAGQRGGDPVLAPLLEEARSEMRSARLSEKEIRLRLKIVESVATVKSYFPHVGGLPETRNSKYWGENDEGSYVPRGRPTEAIQDLWRTKSGIRCYKLSTLVLLKGLIDVSDAKQRAELDSVLQGKVIPNDLPDEGIGTLFERPAPKAGEIFRPEEFLPGDAVWFDNPYFDRLGARLERRYRGQEGHHVFYVGGGKVMDMYAREPVSIDDFRETFLRWGSVRTVAENEGIEPKADEFQIKSVRRVIVDRGGKR